MNTENLKRLREVFDRADDQDRLTTRLKLQEELASKAVLLDAQLTQIEDLKVEVERAQRACLTIDQEWEESHARLERVAFGFSLVSLLVGVTMGVIFAM